MKRPKLKKGSKRTTCSKRYKIQRKVKEHKRKVKKETKKKSVNRKPKRDISVPNDAPFKEDILREAQQRKQMREELRKKQKLERQKEVAKKRKGETKKDKPAEEKTEVKEKKKVTKPAAKNSVGSLCREVNKVIAAADVVLEVLDARDPLGSRCLQAEQAVLQSPNKKLLLLLNKIDLVPKDNVRKWLQFLGKELPTIAFKCSTRVQEKDLSDVGKKVKPGCIDLSRGTVSNGVTSLLNVLDRLCPSQIEVIKVGLIGFSNVGKSSIINTLKQYNVCNVGALRGTTRLMQDVKINERIKIIDSPSLVVSPDNPPVNLFIRSAFQREDDNHLHIVKNILNHCDKQQVILHYNVPNYRSSLEFLELLAHRRGLLKKKGLADLEAAAKLFLNEWMGARLCYYTVPPATFSSHIDGKQTSAMKKLVDCKMLDHGNKITAKGVKSPSPAASIAFDFSQITNGIMDENEIKEQNQEPTDLESDKELMEDDIDEEEKNETQDTAREQSAPRNKTIKSVSFDKPANADDDYDFNADFN